LIRFDEDSRILRELLMAGDTSQFNAKINARFDFFALADTNRHKAYVVCISNGADRTSTFKRNIEFARKIVHIAIVQDVVMNGLREWSCINQFILIDPGG